MYLKVSALEQSRNFADPATEDHEKTLELSVLKS